MVRRGDYASVEGGTPFLPASGFLSRVNNPRNLNPYSVFRSTATYSSIPAQHEPGFELAETTHGKSSSTRPQKKQRSWQNWQGWKGGLVFATALDVLVLLIALISVLVMRSKFRRDGWEFILINGTCFTVKTAGTWIHLFINVLSTALLSTSSYAMQCLMSPTRQEANRAHKNERYVNIGVPSLHNFTQVNRRRAMLYAVIAATSIPIHLLANSAVYTTQGSNSYFLLLVSNNFRAFRSAGGLYHAHSFAASSDFNAVNVTSDQAFMTKFNDVVSRSVNLTSSQCVQAYSKSFVSDYQHVIAVSKFKHDAKMAEGLNVNPSSFLKAVYHQTLDGSSGTPSQVSQDSRGLRYTYKDPSLWTCNYLFDDLAPQVCNAADALSTINDFAIDHWPIDYCLGLPVEEFCQLRGNMPIVLVVMFCALTKAIVLFVTFKTLPTDILATMGDAIASFLIDPEVSTRDCSLMDRDEVKSMQRGDMLYLRGPDRRSPVYAKAWNMDALSKLWLHTIPGWSVFSVALLQSCVFVSAVALLLTVIFNLSYLGNSMAWNIWHAGFGVPNLNFIFRLPWSNETSGVLRNVVLVNLFQLVLSCYYFSYNQAWSDMLIAREWAIFGKQPRTLRVSEPAGAQRSSYFLTIPYRFAIPLQIASALLHWLVSQCFFLVRVNVHSASPFVPNTTSVINTVGYSPIAVVWFIVLFVILTITLWAFAIGMKLESPMPIVGGCSLAISAACHPPKDDEQSWLMPLRWGVVDSIGENGLKHCAFTTHHVYSPKSMEITIRRDGVKGGFVYETRARFA